MKCCIAAQCECFANHPTALRAPLADVSRVAVSQCDPLRVRVVSPMDLKRPSAAFRPTGNYKPIPAE